MSAETLNIVLIVVVVIVATYGGYQKWKRGEEITIPGVAGMLEASIPLATELVDVAQMAVNEMELLKKNGRITNQEAFNRALNIIKGWSPALASIDNDKIITAINSAVLVASALTHQIRADKSLIEDQQPLDTTTISDVRLIRDD